MRRTQNARVGKISLTFVTSHIILRLDKTQKVKEEITAYMRKWLPSGFEMRGRGCPRELPFLYREMFELYDAEVQGVACVIAVRRDAERLSPLSVRKRMAHLQSFFPEPVVYVPRKMMAHDAERLAAAGVAYIVPGRHVSLPFLPMVHTQSPKERAVEVDRMTTCAQLLTLAVLEKALRGEFCYEEARSVVKYSAAAIIEAVAQLEDMQLGMRVYRGRKRFFRFAYGGRALWDAAAPALRNPCKRIVGLEQAPSGAGFCLAAEDALAPLTHLAQKAPSTYAVSLAHARRLKLPHIPRDLAPYRLELWNYPPNVFGGEQVDTLSLALSLRENTDPRTQKELEYLLNNYPW